MRSSMQNADFGIGNVSSGLWPEVFFEWSFMLNTHSWALLLELGFFVLREALSEMHTFGFFILGWVFAETCFLNEALTETHILGFLPH